MTDGQQPTDPNSPTGAYAGFQGRVKQTLDDSTPWWAPRPEPGPDAPNVVVILCDDLGFSDLGCYGSEVETPNIDRLAAEGVQYTNFHVTPMCSPTRAALLTGLNSHLAGVGHVAHSDCGYPGYAIELAQDAVTVAETLGGAGYATMALGKWHLSKDSDLSAAGPQDSWPVQRGFDRFYGFLDAFTNLHHPHRLVRDNSTVEVDRYPDGYYFTDDITDRAVAMVKEQQASNPHQPFFMYFAHGAVHAPMQAKAEDIAKHRGSYDAGWDVIRAQRWERQKELGLLPDGSEIAPPNSEPGDEVVPWDELTDQQRELYARFMEIYAAMVQSIDESLGRLRDELEALGVWENTVVVFTSDNGAAREGESAGTSQFFSPLVFDPDAEQKDYDRLDLLGGPQTLPHYQRGWAYACNTPFRLYKGNTHAGGHQVPLLIAGPGVPADGANRRQYLHVTDLMPTILDLTGVDAPTQRGGLAAKPLAGTSLANTFEDPDAPSAHGEQHYEMSGNRGFYRDGWEAVTRHQPFTPFEDDHWELYNLDEDPTQRTDLSGAEPERVADLQAGWDAAAWENQVYPLDEGGFVKFFQRPERSAAYFGPVRIAAGTPTLERWRCLQLIQTRSFAISIDLQYKSGDEGVLVAHGGQGGGYGLYVEDGRLFWVHNAYGTMHLVDAGVLADGARQITADVAAPGGGIWNVTLSVDGQEVASREDLPHFWFMAPFEGIDVGIDRRSPVSWDIYERHGPFRYTGTLHAVTYEPGDAAPDAPPQLAETVMAARRLYD
ncbi:MAG: arylsulfatase [Acidimicrobiales bacterium]